MKYDFIIIGAGPAGSIAAHKSATEGAKVALIDQDVFPRDKICGNGVSRRGLLILKRIGLENWSRQFLRPQVLRLKSPDGKILDGQADQRDSRCYGRLIPRKHLDEKLILTAIEAGAKLIEGTKVLAIELSSKSIHVFTEKYKLTSQLVILCDGSHATLTCQIGLANSLPELMAVRQYFTGDSGPKNRMEIHFEQSVLPYYCWLFPLEDGRINIGTASYTTKAIKGKVNLRETLINFTTDPTATQGRLIQAKPVGSIQGHPLRTQFGATLTHATRVLVAGDAAGLVNPLTGEGIASAMESGELAATHALHALKTGDFSDQALSVYSRDLETRYGADQRAARILRRGMSFPHLFTRAFHRLRQDRELALLIGYVIIGHKSPRLVLRPTTLLRLLT